MNEATASSLLGGSASGAYNSSTASQPAVCVFTHTNADATRILKITIDLAKDDPHARFTKSEAACAPAPVPLKAIGNEAVTCALDEPAGGRGMLAIGRVRDQLFEILITTTQQNDPVLTTDALRIRLNTAAEQISGNLF